MRNEFYNDESGDETWIEFAEGLSPEILSELKKMKEEMSSYSEVLRKVKLCISKLGDQKNQITPDEKDILLKLYALEKKYIELISNTKVQAEEFVRRATI